MYAVSILILYSSRRSIFMLEVCALKVFHNYSKLTDCCAGIQACACLCACMRACAHVVCVEI